MSGYARIALVAAAILAVAASAADAQTRFGPRNFGPPDHFGTQQGQPNGGQNRSDGREANAAGGWLGVQIQPLDANLADALKLPTTNGALVSGVQMGSPAATAGLKASDVILSVNGRPTNSPRELAGLVNGSPPATKVNVRVWRMSAAQDIAVTLGTRPGGGQAAPSPAPGNGNTAPATNPLSSLGLTLAPAPGQGGGVVIANVDRNGAAGRAGLASGDQILMAGDTTVASIADVTKAIDAARQSGARNVLLRVQSGQSTRFVAVPIG